MRDGLDSDAIKGLFNDARKGINKPLNDAVATAELHGIRRITPYTFRHFMATRVRGLKEIRVDREQRKSMAGPWTKGCNFLVRVP